MQVLEQRQYWKSCSKCGIVNAVWKRTGWFDKEGQKCTNCDNYVSKNIQSSMNI